jgi:aminoglycoside phosphotransferase
MRALKIRPALDAATIVRPSTSAPILHPLKGHSGASVVLHVQGSASFVRKTAASAAANPRLQAQADKQHALWMLGMPMPKILAQGHDPAGLATFDMAYIPGRSLADAVIQAAPFDADRTVKAVGRMAGLFLLSRTAAIPERLFIDKIAEIERHGRDSRATSHMIQTCARMLSTRDWRGIPASPCHGDLSLENILLTAGKSVAFIDCDEPWVSSVWLDFGKLFQDIEGHWCLRDLYLGDQPVVRLANAAQKLEQLRAAFRPLAASADETMPARLPQLAALNLFRAIPYARGPGLIAFLCRRIAHLLEA